MCLELPEKIYGIAHKVVGRNNKTSGRVCLPVSWVNGEVDIYLVKKPSIDEQIKK